MSVYKIVFSPTGGTDKAEECPKPPRRDRKR